MGEFKEYSQGFDAFEKIAAKFQENPLEFKRQFTSNPKQEAITKGLDGKLGELWKEYTELEKQGGKFVEIIRCMDSIIEMNIKSLTTTDDDGRTSVAVEGDDIMGLVWSTKGKAYYDLGKHEEVIKCFDKILELDPKNADAWNNKGLSLDMLGKPEEAIECYDKAIELKPNFYMAWNNYANLLASLGKYDECIKLMDQAMKSLKSDKSIAVCIDWKGVSLAELEKYEEAFKCFQEANRMVPKNTGFMNNLAHVLQCLDRADEGLEIINKVLETDKTKALYWETKGQIHQKLGRDDEAKECFAKENEIKTMHD